MNDRRRFNSVAMFCGPIEAEADHAGEAPRSTPRQDQERRLRRERARVTAVTMSTAAILSPVKRGELSAYRRHLMIRTPVPGLDLAASQHTAGLASDPALRSYPWEGRLMARLTRRSALHEGPLIEPTAATQPWRRLPLFMLPIPSLRTSDGTAQQRVSQTLGGPPSITRKAGWPAASGTLNAMTGCVRPLRVNAPTSSRVMLSLRRAAARWLSRI